MSNNAAQGRNDASEASKQTLRVTRAGEYTDQTGQTPGALRVLGVGEPTGATKIWMGRVKNRPDEWSGPHHHGEAETAGFVFSGEARIYYGEDYKDYIDLDEGDFVFVPPYFPHIEGNRSDTEPLEWVTARTPDNIVINLD